MYMGDIPGRRSRLGMELTDIIFDGPLKHVSFLKIDLLLKDGQKM
jgi:hypothetical protein